jgi:hypothetical protein
VGKTKLLELVIEPGFKPGSSKHNVHFSFLSLGNELFDL